MPRSKGYKRSLASRIMMAERRALTPMPPVSEFVARRGTGCRHRVRRWPTSYLTGRQVKFIPPTFDPEKKTVFVIGDSHLRGLVDGDVAIPEVPLSLSFLSVPGGVAPDLKTELQRLQFPWTPDVVCVLAPSNYLDRGTICDAAVEFGALLTSVRSRWAKVFVLDFPPRLNKPVGLQDLLRQEYHGVAARMGLPFVAVTSGFLLDRLELWCSDGVHLSDTGGSPILVELLCDAALTQFAHDPPAPPSPPRTSPPARVTGPDPLPRRRQDPRRWTRVGQEGKEDQTKPEDKASDSSESSIKESDSSLPPASDWVVPMETDSPPKATSPIQSSESLTSDSSAPSSRSSPSFPSSTMDIKADAKQEAKCNLETKKSLLKEEKNDVIFVKVDTEKEKVEVEQTSEPSRPSSTPPSNTSSHENNSSSGLKRTLSEGFDNDGQAVKREGKRPKVERGELEAELELKITAKAGSHHELEKIVQQLVEERLRVIEMSIYEKNFQELKGRVDKIDCATKHQTAIHTLQAKIARLSKKFGEVNQASENKRKQEALAAAASAKASLATTPQITRPVVRASMELKQHSGTTVNIPHITGKPAPPAPVSTSTTIVSEALIIKLTTSTSNVVSTLAPGITTQTSPGTLLLKTGPGSNMMAPGQRLRIKLPLSMANGQTGTLVNIPVSSLSAASSLNKPKTATFIVKLARATTTSAASIPGAITVSALQDPPVQKTTGQLSLARAVYQGGAGGITTQSAGVSVTTARSVAQPVSVAGAMSTVSSSATSGPAATGSAAPGPPQGTSLTPDNFATGFTPPKAPVASVATPVATTPVALPKGSVIDLTEDYDDVMDNLATGFTPSKAPVASVATPVATTPVARPKGSVIDLTEDDDDVMVTRVTAATVPAPSASQRQHTVSVPSSSGARSSPQSSQNTSSSNPSGNTRPQLVTCPSSRFTGLMSLLIA
ncbi:activating transcription factor 7-interacting protein 1-like isoform X2 [Nerophis ophidion]|uniref:activating transcription factor 7-interacting protein 1-like isoform X2 n=1 Tax=Nerophis ophidion TaxID=159077 RepID=UPI002AE03846|nr:activating transcription factor 7-interacting protein 1-like isoform X2 [Nerophis ophidion]